MRVIAEKVGWKKAAGNKEKESGAMTFCQLTFCLLPFSQLPFWHLLFFHVAFCQLFISSLGHFIN
jgi:hypothetical protein